MQTKRKERSDAQHALKRARVSIQQLDKERAGLVQARLVTLWMLCVVVYCSCISFQPSDSWRLTWYCMQDPGSCRAGLATCRCQEPSPAAASKHAYHGEATVTDKMTCPSQSQQIECISGLQNPHALWCGEVTVFTSPSVDTHVS